MGRHGGRPAALRRAGAGALAAALAVALPGCIVFRTAPTGTQAKPLGTVQLTLEVCASATSGCPRTGNSGEPANTDSDFNGVHEPVKLQVLVGLRIPAAVTAPATVKRLTLAPEAPFTQSPSYANGLASTLPTPPGTKWVGYISPVYTYVSNTGIQSLKIRPIFALPPGPDGAPFPSPFRFLAVTGFRFLDASHPASAPVACASQAGKADLNGQSFCSDDPAPAAAGSAADTLVPTRDLGLTVPGGPVATVTAGGSVSVPFFAQYSGTASPAATFALSATTTVPGGTALVTPGVLVPATDSLTPVSAAVGVPAGTAPGTYDVALRATLADGTVRTATGKVAVLAAPASGVGGGGTPTAKPRVTIVLPAGVSAARARRNGVRVLIGSTKAAKAVVRLYQGPTPKGATRAPRAVRTVRLRAPGPVAVTLRSRRLAAGTFRVTVTGSGFTAIRRGRLTR